jgi:hypothetical protein
MEPSLRISNAATAVEAWQRDMKRANPTTWTSLLQARRCALLLGPQAVSSLMIRMQVSCDIVASALLQWMVQATGPGGVAAPSPALDTPDLGSAETTYKADNNFITQAHGAIMILTFMILMPFGVFLLRVLGLVRWHGINQGIAALLALIGTALGVDIVWSTIGARHSLRVISSLVLLYLLPYWHSLPLDSYTIASTRRHSLEQSWPLSTYG